MSLNASTISTPFACNGTSALQSRTLRWRRWCQRLLNHWPMCCWRSAWVNRIFVSFLHYSIIIVARLRFFFRWNNFSVVAVKIEWTCRRCGYVHVFGARRMRCVCTVTTAESKSSGKKEKKTTMLGCVTRDCQSTSPVSVFLVRAISFFFC